MIRLVLAASLALPGLASAEPSATVPGPPRPAAPDEAPAAAAPCENTMRSDNCSRILACIGEDGLWLDGRANGWERGTLSGRMSDGTTCAGTWGQGGWFGRSLDAELRCDDGRTGAVRYTAQDPETGTGIGRGAMSDGAEVRAWTGRNVLRFLTPEGERRAVLPCEGGAVPIS